MGYRDIKTAYIYIYKNTYKSSEVIEVVAPGSIINFDIPILVVVMYGAKMMSTTSHMRQAGDQRITKKFQGGEAPIGMATCYGYAFVCRTRK